MGMRIRSVKPEFWADKRLAEASPDARLLAIGLLNFADDEGFFLADPALIRSAVFPFDDDSSRVRRSLPELSSIWIETRMTEKGLIGKVRNFKAHQKIDRPKPSQLKPYYEEAEAQPGLPGIIGDESSKDRRGVEANAALDMDMEGNGKEENIPQPPSQGEGSPSEEPENPKGKKKPFEASLPGKLAKLPGFEEHWRLWEKVRREKRAAIKSQEEADKHLEHLKELSGGNSKIALEIVKRSALGGWQGLFALKEAEMRKLLAKSAEEARGYGV